MKPKSLLVCIHQKRAAPLRIECTSVKTDESPKVVARKFAARQTGAGTVVVQWRGSRIDRPERLTVAFGRLRRRK